VRHYYLRQGPNVADLRVNLLPRQRRAMESHAIILRLRRDVAAIARVTGANLKLVEVPPGPPVLATLVAEVYGQPYHRYADLSAAAKTVRAQMAQEPGVVDVDDSVAADQSKLSFVVDREKAALNGVSTEDVAQTLRLALGGMPGGVVHAPAEYNELPIVLQLPRDLRSDAARLLTLAVKGRTGYNVQLGEIGRFVPQLEDQTIFHKNQERVVYVTAEVAESGIGSTSYHTTETYTADTGSGGSGEGSFIPSGQRISMDLKDADIGNVLRMLAFETGMNIVAGPNVTGKVTVALRDVPWDEALRVILAAHGLSYRVEGSIIRVNTPEELVKMAEAEAASPVGTEIITLRYALT